MDNSWTFNLEIDYRVLSEANKKSRLNQVSPLRFKIKADAYEFGKKVFEPPLSVAKWIVVESESAPNFPLKKKYILE